MSVNKERYWALAWLMTTVLWPCLAWAAMDVVKPGQLPALKPDEGFVLVAVDSNVDLYQVRVNRDGKVWGSGTMTDLKSGQSYRLYVAPVGRYKWRELSLAYGFRYQLGNDKEFEFDVAAGAIAYPGDLVFRPTSFWRADIRRSNRGLAAINWLQRNHPAIYSQYALNYSGHYPDPFPAFYKDIAASQTPPPPDPTPAGTGGADTQKDEELAKQEAAADPWWRHSRIIATSLNPAGTLLVQQVRQAPGKWDLDLIDLRNSTVIRLASADMPLASLRWASDQTLLVSTRLSDGTHRVSVVRMQSDAQGKRSFSTYQIPINGSVLDLLPKQPDHILFASYSRKGELMVHTLEVGNKAAVEAFRPQFRERLNSGLSDDVWWLADGDGALRMGIVRRGEDHFLVRRNLGLHEDVMNLSEENDFDPIGISPDASRIYALTDKDRAQRDLVEFDVATRTITRTLYTQPGTDVHTALFDEQRNVIGVEYYRSGQLLTHYFQEADAKVAAQVAAAFPGRTVELVERSRDAHSLILRVDAADMPPQLYHLDVTKGVAAQVGESFPWLAERTFAPTHTLQFTAADDLKVDAFLTLPAGAAPRPLVVFPHGGPIGVADSLHFDPEVQFFASRGYAVLRVNFRGSEGYGRAFREAGHRNYGSGIENDIDAAIKFALARYPIDEQRMCVVGTSYGGYSALVSAVRWPERFRCAVSISGVSDRLLFFTASDTARSEKGRQLAEKLMGNPNEDLAAMRSTSPLYQYQVLTTPVMLVHGKQDARVDFEHSRRMARMLSLAGRPASELYFDDEGHGFDSPANKTRAWEQIASFLDRAMHKQQAAAATGSAQTGAGKGPQETAGLE
ncbi:prolyl oligopeptidase family serine peptidase [Stenotrophomonas sp. SY1]|uniref:alpha/beta hydrolase family protein n=1 Tax=Stenotrophomonas sp. SY1 TaxID=477235 RepID=UPI001E46EA36|nr:prolyl oligopeptidase family serine peptidase [Stenotrophomonas sp. SY1]MCD9087760.1 prolyl oligopeptidase family serine peptidase [Stenotrophomonas sp. SY1]